MHLMLRLTVQLHSQVCGAEGGSEEGPRVKQRKVQKQLNGGRTVFSIKGAS